MKEKFEILESLPCYGNMYISIPENGYTKFSEGLPVKFYKEDGTDWVANFELGFSNLKFASKFKNSNNIIIIASGICYVINPESTKPIITFGYDFNKVFQYKNSFILIGESSITIIESMDNIKHFENLCYDGISEVKLENEILTGILHDFNSSGDYDNNLFFLNLEKLEITQRKISEPKIELKNKSLNINNNIKDKKWWKFW